MKSDFLLAITQNSAEKNLPSEVVLAAVEAALVSAYRKDSFAPNQNISVKINPATGKVQVWAEKTVVERVSDSHLEISLAEAQEIKADAKVGDAIMVEATPANAGRIAAQTAKQVILQRLHEAEHSAIFEEYAGREGDIITGMVQRIDARQLYVDLGKTEALLPATEQVPAEKYRIGQRVKAVVMEVVRTAKGPRVILSRAHPDLLRRLFETEVPEIFNGAVEIKAIAREAGSRSKVAVASRQEGVDPIGCCVGLRGIRIQNIVNELNGEKIDVVLWNKDSAVFIASALSPAQIVRVELGKDEGVASVVVPDRQLSLAIGKEGQNVRLAAKLTGWRIDIKAASVWEAERARLAALQAEEEAKKQPVKEAAVAVPETVAAPAAKAAVPEQVAAEEQVAATAKEEVIAAAEEALEEEVPAAGVAELEAATTKEAAEAPSIESVFASPPPFFGMPGLEEKSQLRFAEDILGPGGKGKSRKKKKKGGHEKEGIIEDTVGARKRRGENVFLPDDDK